MSYYVKPQHVLSPKNAWRLRSVLYDGGFGEWSAAEGQWDPEGQWDNCDVLAIRWNGNDRTPIGLPQSRGLPVWFIVPDAIEEKVREAIEEAIEKQRT